MENGIAGNHQVMLLIYKSVMSFRQRTLGLGKIV